MVDRDDTPVREDNTEKWNRRELYIYELKGIEGLKTLLRSAKDTIKEGGAIVAASGAVLVTSSMTGVFGNFSQAAQALGAVETVAGFIMIGLGVADFVHCKNMIREKEQEQNAH